MKKKLRVAWLVLRQAVPCYVISLSTVGVGAWMTQLPPRSVSFVPGVFWLLFGVWLLAYNTMAFPDFVRHSKLQIEKEGRARVLRRLISSARSSSASSSSASSQS